MEKGISITHVLDVLKKSAGLILGLCLTGLLVSWLITHYLITPQYTSSTKILVNYTQSGEVIQQSDIDINLQMINTYKDIIENSIILDEVRADLNMDIGDGQLLEKIEITTSENSQVFGIFVTDDSPVQASNIANSIATTFQNNISEIMNIENVTIISEAVPITNAVSPNVMLNLAVGVLLGFIVSIVKIFIGEYTDNTIKSEDFVINELEWLNLGEINELTEKEIKINSLKNVYETTNETENKNQHSRLKSKI